MAVALSILTLTAITGCRSVGPGSLPQTRASYGGAIASSQNEQFLQNLVRLRYRETPYFLEVGTITTSQRFESAVGLDSVLTTGGGRDLLSPSAGVKYSDAPTITYSPLQGEQFLRKVLVAVPLESLFVLMQSGWSVNRVFGICVERINGLENAPSASGPTPNSPPDNFAPFDHLTNLLERSRDEGIVTSNIDAESRDLVVRFQPTPSSAETVREIKSLLGLDPSLNTFKVTNNFLELDGRTIAIRSRSIMSILFYLSQTIEAPEEHEAAGFVTVTRNRDGSRFDWSSTPAGRLFGARSSKTNPADAFLAIPFQGYWFYIANDDLDSKASFMLMSQIFNLSAGAVDTVHPTLTIPVGN